MGDNIKRDLSETDREAVVDWMHLAQERDRWRVLLNTAKNLLFREFLD
jgi:hypothetical protein